LVSQAAIEGLIKPQSIYQLECYEAAMFFSRTEGIIVAPETSHAVAMVIREAKKAKEEGKAKDIVFNLSGHGLMDLKGYQSYLAGELFDYALPDEVIRENMDKIKEFPPAAICRTGKW